jgi:hypothetical protein
MFPIDDLLVAHGEVHKPVILYRVFLRFWAVERTTSSSDDPVRYAALNFALNKIPFVCVTWRVTGLIVNFGAPGSNFCYLDLCSVSAVEKEKFYVL